SWPGNVRELRNVIERAAITLPAKDAGQGLDFSYLVETTSSLPGERPLPQTVARLLNDQEMRLLERNNLIAVLRETKWKVSGPKGAAEFLGIHPATLASRLRALNISRSQREHSDE